MQNVIKQIIEMDKEARRLTDEARERRAGSAAAAANKRHEVFDNYLRMARNRVDTIRKVEMQSADEQMDNIEKAAAAAQKEMDAVFDSNRERWTSELVAAVTEGEDLR